MDHFSRAVHELTNQLSSNLKSSTTATTTILLLLAMFRLASIALLVLATAMSAQATCPGALLGTYRNREISFTPEGRVAAGSCTSTNGCSSTVCPSATITVTRSRGDCRIVTDGAGCSDGAGGDVAIFYDCGLTRTQSNGRRVSTAVLVFLAIASR